MKKPCNLYARKYGNQIVHVKIKKLKEKQPYNYKIWLKKNINNICMQNRFWIKSLSRINCYNLLLII